ncbi:MAG TPA: pilus assembly PilX N-terminal domain-containing protein [Malonomonas sp.]
MALILALIMLSIMTVIGMMAMSVSETELSISGNYRALQESFFAADRAVTYAATNPDVYLGTAVIDLFADATHKDRIQIGRSGLDPTAAGGHIVTPLGSGPPPEGSVSDAEMFEARYLMVNATGAYPTDILNPARTEVETQVARIVPKP